MITIIIKALNEEADIARCIASAKAALKGMKGEIVLADSLSEDKTVDIAKGEGIRIVQLTEKEDRSCGMGAQLGYVAAKGDYIYILDADMEILPGFLEAAKKELEEDPSLAGVAGRITEMTDSNIVFSRRKKGSGSTLESPRYDRRLMMGGLYRRSAIERVGHFSNPNLHAYEESDLAVRLRNAGYKLKRIPVDMIKHYGDKKSSLSIVFGRFRSRYLWGCGEYLRAHLFKPTFKDVVKELRIYIAVIGWWFLLAVSLIAGFGIYFGAITLLLLMLFFAKKRSLREFSFSIFSWNMTALGMIFGFFSRQKDFKEIRYRVIR